MELIKLYIRAFKSLAPKRNLALWLVLANCVLVIFQLSEPIIFGKFIDALYGLKGHALNGFDRVRTIMIVWAVVGAGGIATNILVALYADRMSHICRLAAARDYFEHIISLPYAFHTKNHSGSLIKVMYEGSIFLFTIWIQFFKEHLSSIIAIFVLFPITFYMNWRLSLLIIALMMMFCTINAYIVVKTETGQKDVHVIDTKIGEHIGDVVGNIALIQSFTRVPLEVKVFDDLIGNFIKIQFPVLNMWAFASVLTRACATLTVISIFIFGAWLYQRGLISIGEIVTFAGFSTLLIGRLEQLTNFISKLFFNQHALLKFFDTLDTENHLIEKLEARVLEQVAGDVVFENVSLSHVGDRTVVRNISFHIPKGAMVAFAGTTGAGKSTIMGLLCRFWDPQAGRILVDGIDIRDVTLHSLRENIGVVFQENPILYRSLEENFRLGKPDATHEEIERITELVQLKEFVLSQEEQYNTIIGERGRTISGGERQRFGIARALLKNPPILILDEATSALDALTEEKIHKVLAQRRHKQTTFIVAHRLSTIREADIIFVMEHGCIVESGNFDTLMRSGGHFTTLVRTQLSQAAA